MENVKRQAFDEFLAEEGLKEIFEVLEVGDEDNTVLYRSYIQTEAGDVPVVILTDNTIYTVIRFVLGANVVTDANKETIQSYLNEQNSKYKSFKFYIEEQDKTVYLDINYMTSNSAFEPPLVYVLTKQGVDFLMESAIVLKELFGSDTIGGTPHAVMHVEENQEA